MFDKGSGHTVVVVQSLPGRWQWMRRFLEALATQCRVVSYTLSGDAMPDSAEGFDAYVRQLEDVTDRAGIQRAALCGISFGGTVAVRYAARHPDRVTHLVIASAPGPGWHATAQQAEYMAHPLVTLPSFLWMSIRRVHAEVAAALPRPGERLAFIVRGTAAVLRYPARPQIMAERARLMQTVDLADEARHVSAPTLVVTGHPSLDRVVPVESTRQYLTHIPNSRYEMMENTGHTGSLTQPERLARIVGTFVNAASS